MNDPELRYRLAEQARKRSKEDFGDITYLNLVEKFYIAASLQLAR